MGKRNVILLLFFVVSVLLAYVCIRMDNAEMKKYESKFKNTSARAQCKSLVNAVVLYIRDTGVEPEQTDFIDKLLQDDGRFGQRPDRKILSCTPHGELTQFQL
jgi:hypothetical protein